MEVVASPRVEPTVSEGAGHRVFATVFAAACLFHLASSAGLAAVVDRSVWLAVAQLAVGATAVGVIVSRRWRAGLVALCLAVLCSVWLEAPYVGNHWVLAGAVAGAYLTSALWAARRGRGRWATFVPVGQLVLLAAYGFAAFAKLNSGFFDPAVSCAVFYQDQMVTSWGLGGLSVSGHDVLGRAVAVGAVAVELSVPLLLVVRRTRAYGVALAATFHWFLALDLHQHFWDFTSVLFACFLLFLTADQHAALARLVGGAWTSNRLLRVLVVPVVGVWALTATAAAALVPFDVGPGAAAAAAPLALLLATALWWTLGTALLVLVLVVVLRDRTVDTRRIRVASPLLLVVPLLVVANGLTTYLEVKTGYAWNMYSNLRTVAGETNHLLVPGTWDVLGRQGDRVEVLASSDTGLVSDGTAEYVWSEFQEYARTHPQETVRYVRGGETFEAPTLADDPASAGTTGVVERRLLAFRSVDTSGQERCLAYFGPAR
ncbi:hypothetical protein [Aquipuribacter sp. SD81]|uniref:hypothetical protein n=1 Tax=Aquipuribacter sp. SD81 TaxID=3127703 RepID=UPI0030179A6D